MERDEETGLALHGARYYAAWLGRWTAGDPIGLGDGVNRYAYGRGNPMTMRDPRGTLAQDPQSERQPKRVLDTAQKLSAIEQKKLRESQVKFGSVERRTPTGELKDPTGLVAEAVHRRFAGYAKAEDFSQEAVRTELEGLPGFKISGELPEEGEVPVALRGDVALHLAKRFEVPAGEAERLFPSLSSFIPGSGLIDAPPAIKQAAEVTLVLGALFGAFKAGRALFNAARDKLAQGTAIREAAKETSKEVAGGGAAAVDQVVATGGASIKQGIAAANEAGLSQSEAIQALTRIVEASGRGVGGVAEVAGGAKVLTGVVGGAGQPIVHISATGTATFGSATVSLSADAVGNLVTRVTNIVLP